MSSETDSEEMKRELQATLTARRELGTSYDDQFIERLVRQLTTQVRREVEAAPKPRPAGMSAENRTGIAICSLIFGIPLVAIAGGVAGPFGLLIAFAAIVLINVAAGRSW